MRNSRLYEELRRRADEDSLTGLLTHRVFYERLREELERARLSHRPLAVLVLDLDDFKRVNDDRGHLAGDELLRRTANALCTVCRSGDVLGRLGGDELAAGLPGVGPGAELVARRLLRAIAAGGVTASVGIAYAEPGERDPETLVAQADGLLREAKQAGKQTVRLAGV